MAHPTFAGLPVLGFVLLMGVSPLASYASGDPPSNSGGSGAVASSIGVSAVAPNQATNSQTAAGSVYQSPLGGVNNNYQINNGQDTSLGFGPGVYCRGPNLWLSSFGAGSDFSHYNSNSYGGAVTLSIPLGNAADQACKENVQEIARQRKLDTAFTLVKKCAEFIQPGIHVDYNLPQFAQLRDCEGVTILSRQDKVTQLQPTLLPPPPSPTRGL
jgi:hypothetical protein